ncbi:CRISPR-associated protein (Cas_CXXC_CXXC) [Caloramator mitchellensis]|uniref:CRISPR-associated protein (Cas_CXXC_CXXC) n=1 Tax=Caloramator mitchellensis TaxID=908809 RepID=A0A0R3JXQ7_CALMK|nr:type I-B CRISPR-associated protein Cas8b1/Cst1 [Caloramator mitchellensis]KRQ85892.1 CRISPR-associated protein (Cas_CXXC_CXXC) [Caloramator mitchellensis]
MQVRLYMNDWFYNMGLVGMIRIFKHTESKGISIDYKLKDNYLEFESDVLSNFHEYYFDYYIDEYDKDYKRFLNDVYNLSNTINKEENKKVIEKLEEFWNNSKLEKKAAAKGFEEITKNIKDDIKKLKKNLDINLYNNVLKEICNLLNKQAVKEKYALDSIRSIMYDNFFGQVSFLQKSLANKSVEEHKAIMFKDYINPIIIENKVEVARGKGDYSKIVETIESENDYKKIKLYKKFLKNSKKDINQFNLQIDELNKCSICHEGISFEEDFNEGKFLPLGVSNDYSANFFWRLENKYPICDICKLVLLCAPAGITRINKNYIEINKTDDLWKKFYYVFVNLDTDIEDLYKKNESFKNRSSDRIPYDEFVLNIVEQEREKSIWTLQNILFVEFNAKYESKKANLKYFHMNKYVALFFKDYADKTIRNIKDYKFKMEFIDNIFSNGNLDKVIFNKLNEKIKQNFGMDIYFASKANAILNCLKMKGDVDKVKKKVYSAFLSGQSMREHLKKHGSENKISSVAYRLLNTAKVGNKKEFMDTVLRLYINSEIEMPRIFLEGFYEEDVDFETIAQSYISGLITDKNNSHGEVVENE